MIKDFRLGIAMMRNGLNYDRAIGGVFLIIVVALAYVILLPIPAVAGLLVMIGVMGVTQTVHSVTISTMVQSSPYKKKLRTTISAYISFMVMVIGNTICLIMYWLAYLRIENNKSIIFLHMYKYDEKTYANTIIICALLMVAFVLYTTLSNVFFWSSTIVFLGWWIWKRFSDITVMFELFDISIKEAIILSYVIVLIGSVVLYVLNCLLYKFDYHKLSFKGLIKRASK